MRGVPDGCSLRRGATRTRLPPACLDCTTPLQARTHRQRHRSRTCCRHVSCYAGPAQVQRIEEQGLDETCRGAGVRHARVTLLGRTPAPFAQAATLACTHASLPCMPGSGQQGRAHPWRHPPQPSP